MCYRKCGHRPSQIPLCLIEPIFSTKNDRYNMVTYAFEKMQVAKLFIGNAAVCA